MKNLADLTRELEARGRGEELEKLASSEDGQKISRMLDAEALQKAALSGDSRAMQDILQGVLKTEEGKRLSESLFRMLGG